MPLFGLLLLIIEIVFATHAIKRDEWNWVFLILFIPFIGCILYLALVIIPESRYAHNSTRRALSYRDRASSTRKLKNRLSAVDSFSSVKQCLNLADELINKGMVEDTIKLYEKALTDQYNGNADLMLGLAKAYFRRQMYQEAKDTLDNLIKLNPDFRSLEGHLLYARTQEELENYPQAREEYEAILKYSSEVEALCAYAVFLRKRGEDDKSRKYFEQILQDTQALPRDIKDTKRKWISVAKMELQNW